MGRRLGGRVIKQYITLKASRNLKIYYFFFFFFKTKGLYNLIFRNRIMRTKGIELPMNTLVIIAIAILVLLGLTAFFLQGITSPSQNVEAQQNFNSYCMQWVNEECNGNSAILPNVFNAYNQWKQAYKKADGNLCLWSDLGTGGCPTKGEVVSILKIACHCK